MFCLNINIVYVFMTIMTSQMYFIKIIFLVSSATEHSILTTTRSEEHLEIGSEFRFRITILDAIGISTKYADIFCQFKWVK